MAAPIQAGYRRHQQAGWPGDLAKPTNPTEFITGKIGGAAVQAGQAVQYDATNNDFRAVADSDAGGLATIGIVSFDSGSVAATRAAGPTGTGSSDAYAEYKVGEYAKIGIMGTFYAYAAGTIEFGAAVRYDTSEGGWTAYGTALTEAQVQRNPVVCMTHGATSGSLIEVRLAGPTR